MNRFVLRTLAVVLLAPLAALQAAELSFSGVFADHMVLQREKPVPVWGWAEPGARVVVAFAGQQQTTIADAAGKWQVKLEPLKASAEPRELAVTVGEKTVKISDVLVGDVWFCSGQSNMAFAMGSLKKTPYASDLAAAVFPNIRQGMVLRKPSLTPAENALVKWEVCTPDTVGNFTAAGFYFARELQKEVGVPVGLILSAWGGTSVESWTGKEALDTVPGFKKRADEQMANLEKLPDRIRSFPAELAAWEKANDRGDAVNAGEAQGWAAPDAPETDWKPGRLNQKLRDAGLPNGGIAWFRKELTLRVPVADERIRLDLNAVEEECLTAYFNGARIGEWGRKPPGFYNGYVYFDIPSKLIKEGKNIFVLRVVANTGDRPVCKRDYRAMGFAAAGWNQAGDECRVRVEKEYPPLAAAALKTLPPAPKGDAAHTSSALFEGMVRPVMPFAICGALWYQGEADGSRGLEYRQLLPLMIRDWRRHWGQGDFPFLVQQLPNWNAGGGEAIGWAELREAQWLTAKTLTNTFLAVGIDIGEADNVHPANKRDIGKRLALVALAKVYGRPVECAGPIYESMAVEGATIRLTFRSASPLKASDGGPLKQFTLAGPDKVFFPADAKMDGVSVVLSSPSVPTPVAARYAFKNNPEGCNLTNESGLPAVPFRTDDEPVPGAGKRQK